MTSTVLFLLVLAQTAPRSMSSAAPTAPPAAQIVVDGAGAPSFSIPRLDEPVTIDGRLDEGDDDPGVEADAIRAD